MEFEKLIKKMTSAIVVCDGAGAATCFTEDGFYDDVFYGVFRKPFIPDLVENHFHRDSKNLEWEICETASTTQVGFARYIFSYDSKLPEARGKRAVFEGVSVCHLYSGKIVSYHEVANVHTGLSMMDFQPARLSKIAHRQANALRSKVSDVHLKNKTIKD